MTLPFTVDQFFAVFAAYNQAIWPAQIAAYLLALAAAGVALALPDRGRAVGLALVLFWLVNGIGYHGLHFAAINWAAYGFAALFVVHAALLGLWSLGSAPPRFGFRSDFRSILGAALLVYAAAIYPILGWLAGHGYPHAPLLGVAPCPTTIYTIGLLLLVRPHAPRWILGLPLLWAAIGGTAAFLLDVVEDYGLIVAGVAALLALAWPRSAASGTRATGP